MEGTSYSMALCILMDYCARIHIESIYEKCCAFLYWTETAVGLYLYKALWTSQSVHFVCWSTITLTSSLSYEPCLQKAVSVRSVSTCTFLLLHNTQRASHPRPHDFYADLWWNSRGSSSGIFLIISLWKFWRNIGEFSIAIDWYFFFS